MARMACRPPVCSQYDRLSAAAVYSTWSPRSRAVHVVGPPVRRVSRLPHASRSSRAHQLSRRLVPAAAYDEMGGLASVPRSAPSACGPQRVWRMPRRVRRKAVDSSRSQRLLGGLFGGPNGAGGAIECIDDVHDHVEAPSALGGSSSRPRVRNGRSALPTDARAGLLRAPRASSFFASCGS